MTSPRLRGSTRPHRVVLSRARGWRMPPDTVKVDRSTKWGNPFKVGAARTAAQAVRSFKLMLGGFFELAPASDGPTYQQQLHYYLELARRWRELAGKNLACWCRKGQPCHVDVLLKAVRIMERRKGR